MSSRRIPKDERDVSDLDFFRAIDLDRPALRSVRRTFDAGDLPVARVALVEYFRKRERPRWFFDLRDGRRGRIPSTWHGHRDDIIERANCVLDNRFHLAADQITDFGANLRWRNPATRGMGSQSIHLKWNSFLRDLAIAYARTGRRVYALKFAELTDRWLTDWPFFLDEHFTPRSPILNRAEGYKAMPSAFRMISWLDCLHSGVGFAPEVPVGTTFRMLKTAYVTMLQYKRFRRRPYKTGNHHIWECGVAPFIFGVMFREIPGIAALVDPARAVIAAHARRSFWPDGGYEERSTSYTWVALKMFLMAVRLAKINRVRLLSASEMSRVKRGVENQARAMLPDGTQPDIGDQRSTPERSAKLLGEAASLFRSRAAATTVKSLRLTRLADPENRSALNALAPKRAPLAACFPDSGWLVARDAWSPAASAMALSIPPDSALRHHSHDDPLSLQLVAGGMPLVGTPMTELYSVLNTDRLRGGLARKHFYAMTSHNVVLVEGRPARPLDEFTGFGKEPIAVTSEWHKTKSGVRVVASHVGYPGFRLARDVGFEFGKGWTVCDVVDGPASKKHVARWHFEYGVEVRPDGEGFVAHGAGSLLRVCFESDSRLRPRLYRDERWLARNPLRPGVPAPWVLDVRFGGGEASELVTRFEIL